SCEILTHFCRAPADHEHALRLQSCSRHFILGYDNCRSCAPADADCPLWIQQAETFAQRYEETIFCKLHGYFCFQRASSRVELLGYPCTVTRNKYGTPAK